MREADWKSPPPEPTGWRRAFARMRAQWRTGRGIEPLSALWGTDRGQPVHRLYLEQFLSDHRADMWGHCLEFQDPTYVPTYGGERVTRLDILHVDDTNPIATLVADLTKPNTLPSDTFDCIVCTHVLHVIYDVRRAVAEMHRVLRPGGVLLVGSPGISMADPELFTEYWRFTPDGMRDLLGEAFGRTNVKVVPYGNSLTAAGDLRGRVAHEFTEQEIAESDPRFALEVCARAVKA